MSRPTVAQVVEQFLASSVAPPSEPPIVTIVMGGPAVGKTRTRRREFGAGHVVVDAAEIFVALAPDEVLPFPDALASSLEEAGSALSRRALAARRPIVTEIIGDEALLRSLLDGLQPIGYRAHLVLVEAKLATQLRNNEARGENNISAVYAEPYNVRWLLSAARELAERWPSN